MSSKGDSVTGPVLTNGMPFSDEQDVAILSLIYKHKAHLASAGNRFSSMRPVVTDYLRQKLSTPIVPGRYATPHIVYWRFLHLIRSRPSFDREASASEPLNAKISILDTILQERRAHGLTIPTTLPTNSTSPPKKPLPSAKKSLARKSVGQLHPVGNYGKSLVPPARQSSSRYPTVENHAPPDDTDNDVEWVPTPAVRRKSNTTSDQPRFEVKRARLDDGHSYNPGDLQNCQELIPGFSSRHIVPTPVESTPAFTVDVTARSPAASSTGSLMYPLNSADENVTLSHTPPIVNLGLGNGIDSSNDVQEPISQEPNLEAQPGTNGGKSQETQVSPKELFQSEPDQTTHSCALNDETFGADPGNTGGTSGTHRVQTNETTTQHNVTDAPVLPGNRQHSKNESGQCDLLAQTIRLVNRQLEVDDKERVQLEILSQRLVSHREKVLDLLIADHEDRKSLMDLFARLAKRREKLTDALSILCSKLNES